jgi:selenocysteine lyase/cysteine desulfurase
MLLVDAAQSLGHIEIDVEAMGIDMLAAPGHKGLLGPLGTGVLYLREGLERLVGPLRQGGTGSQSDEEQQPLALPDKYEAGNHNLPGLAGLAAGAEFLLAEGVHTVAAREQELTRFLWEGLAEIEGVRLHGPVPDVPALDGLRPPVESPQRVGVVSATLSGYDPHEVASMLHMLAGVECRAGLHCASRIHRRLGTAAEGTLRFSPGYATTEDDLSKTLDALKQIAHAH